MENSKKSDENIIIDDLLKEGADIGDVDLGEFDVDAILKETDIYTLPKYLIIYFGRYNDDYFIENNIDFPKEMDFKNFIIKENKNNLNNYNYKLRSIIFYTTIEKIGHYCASCLNNNNWIYFDDDYIEKYNEKSSNGIPIILFYEKDN